MKNLNAPLTTTTIMDNIIEVDSPHSIDNPSFNDSEDWVKNTLTNLFKTMYNG